MRSILPAAVAGLVIGAATAACAASAAPTLPPADAVSTIVAETIAATTPQPTATGVAPTQPTLALPTPSSTQVAPTPPPTVVTLIAPNITRINFLDGATTAVLSAPIQPGQVQVYALQAFQAQPMLVNVGSLNNDVTISIKTQGGTTMLNQAAGQTNWQGTLPQTEDYYLAVHGGGAPENFTLTVTIPSRIKFEPGADSTKVTGKTVAGYGVSYTAFAIKGQKMSVQLANLSGTAALTIYGFADGQPYVRSASAQTSFAFTLPATQDYIIEVVPKAGREVNYQMIVRIQ